MSSASTVLERVHVNQRRTAFELPHFRDEITRTFLHDWREMPEGIAARHLHATGFEHEHARRDFSRDEQRLTLAIASYLPEAQ
jgi:hypothetical protein